MIATIHRLDEATINKIKAGEVIESTASVIKELVENSLDAGATQIDVEISQGGRERILVKDNGIGMSPEDAQLAIERHATSKLRSAEDIFALQSFGFRGEALPSIASISQMQIKTGTANSPGTLLIVRGGEVCATRTLESWHGTEIEVKELFFNVPVRKRFQRSPQYDAQEVHRLLRAIALAHPQCGFSLKSQGDMLLQCSPDSTFADRTAKLLDKQWMGIHLHEGDTICGFFSMPWDSRPNRTQQYLFVNKRFVQSPWIGSVVREAYGAALPEQRYPLFVLHLNLPPDEIDPNVHPKKSEVRFRDKEKVHRLLFHALRHQLALCGEMPAALPISRIAAAPSLAQAAPISWKAPTRARESIPNVIQNLGLDEEARQRSCLERATIADRQGASEDMSFGAQPTKSQGQLLNDVRYMMEPAAMLPLENAIPHIHWMRGHFCLYELDGSLRLVHLTRLRARAMAAEGATHQATLSPLLAPIRFELAQVDSDRLLEYLDALQEIGLELGTDGTQWTVQAASRSMSALDIERWIHEFLEDPEGTLAALRSQDARTRAAAISRAAACCRTPSESEVLFLLQQPGPRLCPLGRPIERTLDEKILESLVL